MKIEKITGLVAAPFAPMKNNGDLNPDIIPLYYGMLKSNNISGVFINGTTGEGVSLSFLEKKLVTDAWVKADKESGAIKIINLVGGNSVRECGELALYSYQKGVYAISVLPPYYFKPSTIKELVDFFREIAGIVPELPVYYYHIPSLTGVYFPMLEFMCEVGETIPNFRGIKYSHCDLMDYFSCLRHDNYRYDIFWGTDETLLSALVLGCTGAVGSTYNYLAPLFSALIKKFESGDLKGARKLQEEANELIYLLDKYGGIRAGKAFMRYIGLDCGKFRSPLNKFEEEKFRNLSEDLKAMEADKLMSVCPKKSTF